MSSPSSSDDVVRGRVEGAAARGAAHTVSSGGLWIEQQVHFGLCNLAPLALAVAGIWWSAAAGVGALDILLFLGFYLATTIGIEVGYHRGFTHQAYHAKGWVRRALAILGAMAAQGPPAFWVAIHRRHHAFSDRNGDPHSPRNGPLWAHWTWMLDRGVTNIKRFAPDILADQAINLSKPCYYSCVLMGLALPAAIGGLVAGSLPGALSGFYWGGVLRLVVVQHGVYFINSGCHSVGHRRFLLRDNSRNLGVLALPTLGGSLHNNHHAFPSSATTALAPGDVDPGFMIIDALRRLGLVFDIVVPSHAAVAAKSMGRLGRSARTRRQQDDA